MACQTSLFVPGGPALGCVPGILFTVNHLKAKAAMQEIKNLMGQVSVFSLRSTQAFSTAHASAQGVGCVHSPARPARHTSAQVHSSGLASF